MQSTDLIYFRAELYDPISNIVILGVPLREICIFKISFGFVALTILGKQLQ